MSPPGFEAAANMGIILILCEDGPVRNGWAGIFFRYRHFFSIIRVAPDRAVYRTAGIPEMAVGYSFICSGEASVGELGGKELMRLIRLGSDQKTGGILVDPMDDARTLCSSDPGKGIAAVMEKSIDQRTVRMAGGGVNDEPSGFVDHDHGVILKANVQRDVLRKKGEFLQGGKRDFVDLPGGSFLIFFV